MTKCPLIIKEGWGYMMKIKERPADWAELSTIFNTCDPITSADNIDSLYRHLNGGFSYMAMTDYPYETSFL
jgi:hypothetical protein